MSEEPKWDEAAARRRYARLGTQSLEGKWPPYVPPSLVVADLRHAFAKIDAQEATIKRLRADLIDKEL